MIYVFYSLCTLLVFPRSSSYEERQRIHYCCVRMKKKSLTCCSHYLSRLVLAANLFPQVLWVLCDAVRPFQDGDSASSGGGGVGTIQNTACSSLREWYGLRRVQRSLWFTSFADSRGFFTVSCWFCCCKKGHILCDLFGECAQNISLFTCCCVLSTTCFSSVNDSLGFVGIPCHDVHTGRIRLTAVRSQSLFFRFLPEVAAFHFVVCVRVFSAVLKCHVIFRARSYNFL